ncbi:aquaporin [Paraburkholderia sp. LEh10]|jgi:aquaporin Z|uniref:aquaporin n=1 Tax=Paraburkholderia sp. LEh10 TaxID=2821353 RepID=UPI001AE43AA2|nr:aquaporin [Paraburkholderia sp. LEh10]MBP0588930.1 aquaporin [Paraburkholderia sp. LEh10]
MSGLVKRLIVEGAGTAWLVFIGCGTAVFNSGAQGNSILAMPLAFGFALTTATYVLGRFSGAHFNPAVTVGFVTAQRFPVRYLAPYIAAQILGAVAGAALLAYIASGRPGFELAASEFGANGYGDHSPADYQLHSALAVEVTMSFAFVMARMLMSGYKSATLVSPLVAGVWLALSYVVAAPITNASLNPARSTGPALFVGDWALDQLWLFWAAPLAGGVLAGLLHSRLPGDSRDYRVPSPYEGRHGESA